MKKVFDVPLDKPVSVLGLSAVEAKALMPGRVIKDTDPANFEDLFKKVAIAASHGKVGIRMNFQQQKMCSHFKDELRTLGYEVIETDLKWAPGDNIAYDKMLDPADIQKIDTFSVIEQVKKTEQVLASTEQEVKSSLSEPQKQLDEPIKEPEKVESAQEVKDIEPEKKRGLFGRLLHIGRNDE